MPDQSEEQLTGTCLHSPVFTISLVLGGFGIRKFGVCLHRVYGQRGPSELLFPGQVIEQCKPTESEIGSLLSELPSSFSYVSPSSILILAVSYGGVLHKLFGAFS